ncbi:MAG TPA: hypothetical protein DDW23_01605 [Planctomycetes bacterium]|nr:hypothetical protein [Planctomycetota bacterium]
MFNLSVAEIATIVNGELLGDRGGARRCQRVVVDSRQVQPGDLFVALPGARADGHMFLREAKASGAQAVLVSRSEGLPESLAGVEVADCLEALHLLAKSYLSHLSCRVVGITGSVGKTTAKDFLSTLLQDHSDSVFASPASWNSEIGLPLSILSTPDDTKILILEYGINAPGEMDRLVATAPPDFAWVTSIGEVHLEGLRDVAGVAREKGRLPSAVPAGGGIWFGPGVSAMCSGPWRVVPKDLNPWDEESASRGQPGAWEVPGFLGDTVVLPFLTPHEAILAWSSGFVAVELGVHPSRVDGRLPSLTAPKGRMTLCDISGLVLILDDSYNSSPPSLKASLLALSAQSGSRRRIAVLGTMQELGAESEAWHRKIGKEICAGSVDVLVGVGLGGKWIAEEIEVGRVEVVKTKNATSAGALLGEILEPGDCLLLKASRSEGLEIVIDAVKEWARVFSSPTVEGAR